MPGLWARDGQLLAEVPPQHAAASSGATLHLLPLVRGQVVFSAADCGSAPPGLRTTAFDGPLAEVPGSRSSQVARCTGRFQQAPLSRVRRLLARP